MTKAQQIIRQANLISGLTAGLEGISENNPTIKEIRDICDLISQLASTISEKEPQQ